MSNLEQMTMQEVDEIYIDYHSANTETSFSNRELSFEELGRKKVHKTLYKNCGKLSEYTIPLIQNESGYKGEGIAFCTGNCTYYFPDHCNIRTYLYTYKAGKAVMLSPGEDTIYDYYGYSKPFRYAERKGMAYCDYYYPYSFTTCDNETDIIDNVTDNMSWMDIWDFETMASTSSNANIQMLHAVYYYMEDEYDDADFSYEYYVNVSDIIRRLCWQICSAYQSR